jgi:uncharacterized repeat protein (TIGR01451 family)
VTHAARRLGFVLFAALTFCAAGCFGWSSNPSYFPYLLPSGDVVRTHAKPIGPGYYANFDPHAVDLALEPQVMTSQVGSQVVVLATVRDEKSVPRRNRRVDWIINGGNLVEVDESGYFNARGGKDGNTGWSFTSWHEDRLSRGNNNPADDIMVRPGQTWCVVSSPVEGDTHITAIVPGVYNWDKRMKTTVVRWVDAVWELPPRASSRFGVEHEFVTKIFRFTDRQPLAKYRVRYKILDGPPAVLLPSRAQEDIVVSDLNGQAKVRIAQLAPASGVNRVAVEIIRPPDPTTPTGAGVPIVSGETAIEWLAPNVQLGHSGPPTAALGQNVVYFTTVKNEGRIDSQLVMLTMPIPAGLEFVSANPPAEPRNGQLEFPFGVLGVGQVHTVQTTFKAKQPGLVKSIVLMKTGEGATDQKEVNTTITQPGLKAEILAPATGILGVPIAYTVRVSNPGSGDLDGVSIALDFDVGLESEFVKNPANDPKLNRLNTTIARIPAGSYKDEALVLTPRQAGALTTRVQVSAAGLADKAQHVVNVQKPNVSLRVQGPAKSFVGRPVDWRIIVKNEGVAEQSGIVVRDRLPAELGFKAASRGGSYNGNEVTWTIGNLKPNEEVTLELNTESRKAAAGAEKVTLLTADGGVSATESKKLQIDGIAALKLEMKDRDDVIEVGKNVIYDMTITNTGSAPCSKIDVKASAPDALKFVRVMGPTKENVLGQTATFARIDNLQPGEKISFTFVCEALKAGKVIFHAEYTSELNQVPIGEDESTTILAAPGGAIPAPPGGGVPLPLPPGKN